MPGEEKEKENKLANKSQTAPHSSRLSGLAAEEKKTQQTAE